MPSHQFLGIPNWVCDRCTDFWVFLLTIISDDSLLPPQVVYVPVGVRNVGYNGANVGAQQKCLAHLRRHFKKVLQIGHGNNTVVAEAFLELIDEAFRQHRTWREHPLEIDYQAWARDFKTRLAKLLNTWQGHVGHAAGLSPALVARESTSMVVLFRPPIHSS